MRLIGSLNSESDARRFGDYLLSVEMPSHVEEGRAGDWQVWIERDDHLEQAVAQFHAYQANPNDPKYADAGALARRARKEEQEKAERRRRNFRDVRTSGFFAAAGQYGTPICFALIALCLLVAVFTRLGVSDDAKAERAVEALLFQPFDAFARQVEKRLTQTSTPARTPTTPQAELRIGKHHPATMFSSIAAGEAWRLFTPALLHFGILHLLFNLSWLASLGRAIESRKGPLFFGGFVLISAAASNAAEALWAVFGFGNPLGWTAFGGMSGVVYALIGYAWISGRLRPYEGVGLSPQAVNGALAWLVLCMTGLLGPVANTAHVGGLIVGAAIAAWPAIARKMRQR